jgi:CheY-like chemotaxis protein
MKPMPERQIFLYVEDTENDVALVRTAIAKGGLGIELKTVRDGEELICYLEGKEPFSDRAINPIPTLVLLDLKMPKKDGFQVLEWLRQQPHLKRVVVIVLTASSRQEDVDRSHDLGANAVLVKPASFDELIDMLEQVSTWLELTRQPHIDERRKKAP